mmetsp:Transcript_58836/g.71935  ORF Transcript_58836/g.71935 Transcript_58836/m.71935 type:complete len:172 (+) Transcript_58836:48-563(+)
MVTKFKKFLTPQPQQIKLFSTLTTQNNIPKPLKLETQEDAAKFLMHWEFVKYDTTGMLQSLRQGYMKFGSLTEKQLDILKRSKYVESILSTKKFFPDGTNMDPVMLKLCFLNESDWATLQMMDQKDADVKIKGGRVDVIRSTRNYLEHNGYLSYKQLRLIGNILFECNILK